MLCYVVVTYLFFGALFGVRHCLFCEDDECFFCANWKLNSFDRQLMIEGKLNCITFCVCFTLMISSGIHG